MPAHSISISSFVHGRDALLGYMIPASGFPERNRCWSRENVIAELEKRWDDSQGGDWDRGG